MAKSGGILTNAVKYIKNALVGYEPHSGPELFTSRVGLFDKNVSVKTLREMFMRDELLNAAVRRLASDVFDNWAEIIVFKKNGTANEDATRKLRRQFIALDVVKVFRAAFVDRLVSGFSVVGLGFPGNITEPAEEGASPTYISHVPFSNVVEFNIDLRPDSEEYGQISGMVIRQVVGTKDGDTTGTRDITVHPSRFVHWPMSDLDGTNPMGMSALLPLHDLLSVKKNVDWSLGEALYQFAVKHYVFQFPPNTPDDVYKSAKNNLKDFSAVTSFVYRGDKIELDAFGGEGQLNPEPYTRYFTSLLSIALGVPYPVLFRGLTGGVSDVIQRDYASDIAAIQSNEVEPAVRAMLRKMGIDDSDIEFKWRPVMEMTEQEKAFIRSRHMLGRNLQAKAMGFFLGAGLAIELDEAGWIKRVFVPDGKPDNIILPTTKEVLPKPPDPDDEEEEAEVNAMIAEDEARLAARRKAEESSGT